MSVEIWTDVTCPYSYLGVTRFRQALEAFEHADQVEVTHCSFRLLPGATPQNSAEVLSRKLGVSIEQIPALFQKMEQTAASAGLAYRLDGTVVGDTLDAQRLRKFAETKELGDEVVERLFRGYFSELASIFDKESLVTLATEAGLDPEETRGVLNSDAFRAEVEADQQRHQELGGRGVPFFLINGKPVPSGELHVFTQALTEAWSTR
jgi:predicted DsbA family dithiol-disulfide isomerase